MTPLPLPTPTLPADVAARLSSQHEHWPAVLAPVSSSAPVTTNLWRPRRRRRRRRRSSGSAALAKIFGLASRPFPPRRRRDPLRRRTGDARRERPRAA